MDRMERNTVFARRIDTKEAETARAVRILVARARVIYGAAWAGSFGPRVYVTRR